MPEWYWKSGLHDAQIIRAAEIGYRRLKLTLDSSGALYDRSVRSITLVNCEILTAPEVLDGLWWQSDELQFSDGGYVLNAELADSDGERIPFTVRFSDAQVERFSL